MFAKLFSVLLALAATVQAAPCNGAAKVVVSGPLIRVLDSADN